MPFMYILKCGDGTFYTGSCRNLELRMEQHYAGLGGTYTAKRQPVELVYREEFSITSWRQKVGAEPSRWRQPDPH